MHQRRSSALAAPFHRGFHRAIRGQKIRAIHFLAKQPGKPSVRREMLPPAVCASTARRWVAVVFHQKQDRQAAQAGRIQRFPEFAFAGGALAARDQRDFVREAVVAPLPRSPPPAETACRWATMR